MSPRAACRLERLGFEPVYDYTVGKADWLAAGLPSEGQPHPARVLEAADRHPATCRPGDNVAAIAARFPDRDTCVVVDDHDDVVLGRLRPHQVDPADERRVEDVMEPGPATVRADADLAETLTRMNNRHVTALLVTDPDGVLLGELRPPTRVGDERQARRP